MIKTITIKLQPIYANDDFIRGLPPRFLVYHDGRKKGALTEPELKAYVHLLRDFAPDIKITEVK